MKSEMSMICVVGGLIGLFLGVSIFSVEEYFRMTFKRNSCIPYSKIIQAMIVVLLLTITCIFSGFQLKQYFFQRPHIVTQAKYDFDDNNHFYLTVCAWPPFSVSHLIETVNEVGFNMT